MLAARTHNPTHLQRLTALILSLAALTAVALFVPTERTLGENIRLVTVHGAWVWVGKLFFALAALTGLAALVSRRKAVAAWSLALGRTGLFYWLTYLPMSLLLMQLNWGGLFLDEPRWRVPFTFGVVAVLLQIALALFNHADLTALGNLLFGAALWWQLGGIENVLHPDSPIFGGGALNFQLFFVILAVLSLAIGAQVAFWLHAAQPKP